MHSQTISHALPPGYQLDTYEIIEAIGSGGFGITYKALDTQLKHLVAIKEYLPVQLAWREEDSTVIPRTSGDVENFDYGLLKFIEEGRTLARFKHSNIVRVVRYFKANGTAYLVMEYELGQTFKEFLQIQTRPDEDILESLLDSILQGLKPIHDQGFLHRDIKPSNIYLRENGNPLLIDFGSARQALTRQTQSLTGIVTEGFAPFEQYTGNIQQTAATDLYSLGATLYFAISGKIPMNSLDRFNSLHTNNKDPHTTLSQSRTTSYSQFFLKLIDWLLEIQPENRPQTTDDVLESLRTQSLPDLTKTQANPNLHIPTSQRPVIKRSYSRPVVLSLLSVTTLAIVSFFLFPFGPTQQIEISKPGNIKLTPAIVVTQNTHKSVVVKPTATKSFTRVSAKVFKSINGQVNASLVVVPYDKNKFLLQYKNFEHKYDNKTFLYTKTFKARGTNSGSRYHMTGTGGTNFMSLGKKTLIKGSVREYSEVTLTGKTPVKMIFVKNAETATIQQIKAQYLKTQGILKTKVAAQKHIQVAVNQFNKKCRANLAVEIDWKGFESITQTTTPGMAYAYIKALERVCAIDEDYGSAARKIQTLVFKPSKIPGKDKLINIAGTRIKIFFNAQVANISVTSYRKFKEIL